MQPLTPWLPVWHKLESRFPPRYISPFTTLHLKKLTKRAPFLGSLRLPFCTDLSQSGRIRWCPAQALREMNSGEA